MFLLLSCWILTGIRAEDATVTHYKMKNSSICLNVTKPPPYLGGSWKFAGMLIASKEHMNPRFAKKVEFSPKNLTLCIKGLTHTDTGIYEATINDRNFTQSTEKHRVIVQDSVPRPAVQVSVLHSNQSAGLCSTAVNCSVRGEWALADCDEDGCRASQRSRPEVIRITISTVNWTVVCSANNHVSAETESANMATACFNKPDPEHREESLLVFKIVILCAVCAALIIFIALLARKVSSECNHRQRQTLVEEQPQPETRGSTSSSSPSEVAYENVDATQPAEEMGAAPSQEVETVYSVLQAVAPPPVESETLGEASHSLTITEEEAGPSEVNTLYSVLQKPKTLKSQRHQQVT